MVYVSTIISGAACLGVLLALISGIFLLVLAATKWMRVRSSLNEEELARQRKFLISSSCLLDSPAFLETRKKENGFGGTFNGGAQQELDESFQSTSERPLRPEEENEQKKEEPSSDTVKVRELMEKMAETMIGGPLDGTTVGRLSTHSAYKNEVSEEVKDSGLKLLIQQIVAEAMDLPNIKDCQRAPKTPKDAAAEEDVESKSYEDILATAILNKVIESFQNKNHKESLPFPKPRVRQRKLRRNDANDSHQSDGDWSDTSRSDQLSLTIEEYIEEVTTALEASEDERSELSDCETTATRRIPFPESGRTVVDGTDDENSDAEDQSAATELITTNSSWEENWLFQKKRLRSTPNAHHPVPVPMLVPNPSEEFRALVGGVDADDLSDMSDCSDFALEELTTEKPSTAEEIAEGSSRQVKVVLAHITEEAFSPGKCESTGADDENGRSQTKENTEEVRQKESLSVEDTSETEEQFPAAGSVAPPASTDSEDSLRSHCRVAQREKEKWMHPVPLPDNPYSLENIEKREQQRKTNQYFRIGTYTGDSIDFPDYMTSTEDSFNRKSDQSFTRDYYINASKHPSGMSSPPAESDRRLQSERDGFSDVPTELTVEEMADDSSSSDAGGRRLTDRTEFSLPSVRELAKHFAAEESRHPNDGLQTRSESKHSGQLVATESPEQEVDYSTVPVSEIILNLQQAAEFPARQNRNHVACEHTRAATQMEILWKVESNFIVENHAENGAKAEEGAKYNGKQVHSLTARSISKEFREGLKNSSYQKVFPKVDRISSGGESDQGDVACNKTTKLSPTPSVDLKNMKKFWEEIITANSNSTKQK